MAATPGTLAPARALALAVPAALLAGAWGFQLIGHLVPCEMCHWQRWPLYGALVAALLAYGVQRPPAVRAPVVLAGLLIVAGGLLGAFHAGVEYGWWRGPQHCTALTSGGGLRAILAAPLIRCDVPQWTLVGISLAGWNALFSLAGGTAVLALASRRAR